MIPFQPDAPRLLTPIYLKESDCWVFDERGSNWGSFRSRAKAMIWAEACHRDDLAYASGAPLSIEHLYRALRKAKA